MLRALFVSSRPLSWVNTAFPFAAAYFVTSDRICPALVVGTIYFLIPYNLAMYGINDVFDYESDLRNPRKGGVEGALLDPRLHRPTLIAALVTNVPFLVFLVIVGSAVSWLVLAISVFAVLTRRRWQTNCVHAAWADFQRRQILQSASFRSRSGLRFHQFKR